MSINKWIRRLKITLRLIPFVLFLFQSQIIHSQNLSRKRANLLAGKLLTEKTDTGKFNTLVKLARFQISKSGELKTDLDSARKYLDRAGQLLTQLHSNEANAFFNLVSSYFYNEAGQKELSATALNKAIAYAKAGKDKSLLGAAYEESANQIETTHASLSLKIHLQQLAVAAYSMTENKRKLGDCLRILADVRMSYMIDYKALPELDSAKLLYQQARSGDWQQLYILYSRFYSQEHNHVKELDAILDALRMTAVDDSTMEACELNNYAAMSFANMKEYQKAIPYAKKALEIAEKHHSVTDAYTINLNITFDYHQLGKPKAALVGMMAIESKYLVSALSPADRETDYECNLLIYDDLKQYSKALVYYNYLKEMIEHKVLADDYPKNGALAQMVKFCIGTKQFKTADILLQQKKALTKQLGANRSVVIEDFTLQIALDTTLKNYKSAAMHLFELKAIKDSLYNETQAKQQQAMEAEYKTEEKENENKLQRQNILALTGEQKLQRAELKTATVVRNMILLSAFAVFVIAVLIYRQYDKGKKSNIIIGQKNKRLEQLLAENEWLLKEVHHRVKNNLQIIASLLNSQSAYLTDDAAMEAIMKSKGRVESISLIHQKLYKTTNYSSINMPEYIHDLVDYLKDSFESDQKIYFDLAVAPILLDVGDAVPIGLIINEGVTNSIKYAFSNAGTNVIEIGLKTDGEELILEIKDNGKGFVEDKERENSSFGLLLMDGLAKQLNGEFERLNDGGTVIRVKFKPMMALA